jgi:hypothetical protein
MKTYSLSKDLINHFDDFRNSVIKFNLLFPGLLYPGKLTEARSKGDKQACCALVMFAFLKHIETNNFVYSTMENALGDSFIVDLDHLTENNVDIESALEYGFIVANNFIQLSAEEIKLILYSLDKVTSVATNNIAKSIIKKLSDE